MRRNGSYRGNRGEPSRSGGIPLHVLPLPGSKESASQEWGIPTRTLSTRSGAASTPQERGYSVQVSLGRFTVLVGPQERVIGVTFALRVSLPSRFNGKYDPASRPSSTPILLKPGERRRLPKPAKPKPVSEPKLRPPKKVSPPRAGKIPGEQHEVPKQTQPERREAFRKAAKNRRERAKELGLCRDCREQAIPDQTRCEPCAEKHRGPAPTERRHEEKREG